MSGKGAGAGAGAKRKSDASATPAGQRSISRRVRAAWRRDGDTTGQLWRGGRAAPAPAAVFVHRVCLGRR
jgi:hypothetical protein